LHLLPPVGPILIRLIRSGLKEQDIIKLGELIERYRGSGRLDLQLMVDEIEMYSSTKIALEKSKLE
jgi:hypothetical protein